MGCNYTFLQLHVIEKLKVLIQMIITDRKNPALLIGTKCKISRLSLRLVPCFARAGHIYRIVTLNACYDKVEI